MMTEGTTVVFTQNDNSIQTNFKIYSSWLLQFYSNCVSAMLKCQYLQKATGISHWPWELSGINPKNPMDKYNYNCNSYE